MRFLFRTWRHGRGQTIAFEDYQWTEEIRYYRTSDWFINFPFCHNDTQIWVSNAAITFLTLLLLGNLLGALLRAVFKPIF